MQFVSEVNMRLVTVEDECLVCGKHVVAVFPTSPGYIAKVMDAANLNSLCSEHRFLDVDTPFFDYVCWQAVVDATH